MSDLQWPPQEKDFVVMLQKEAWCSRSMQSFEPDCDIIFVQSLMTLKTTTKDDKGKTGCILMRKLWINFNRRTSLTSGHPCQLPETLSVKIWCWPYSIEKSQRHCSKRFLITFNVVPKNKPIGPIKQVMIQKTSYLINTIVPLIITSLR